jgi:uncharacterized protein YjcR
MNEVRAPDQEQIKQSIKADYQKGIKPKELSEKHGISVNTIKSWIKRYDWNKKEVSPGASSSKKGAPSKRGKGAPLGNQNSKNHGAPEHNTNALKHGGYSKVYWDMLDDEEQEMIEGVPTDEEVLLIEQIQLFSVRERRIMKAINKYRDIQGGLYVAGVSRFENKRTFKDEEEEEQYNRIQEEKVQKKEILPGKSYQITTNTSATVDVINRLERELTSVQARKTACIEALTNLRFEKRKELGDQRGNELVRAWAEKVMQTRRNSDG